MSFVKQNYQNILSCLFSFHFLFLAAMHSFFLSLSLFFSFSFSLSLAFLPFYPFLLHSLSLPTSCSPTNPSNAPLYIKQYVPHSASGLASVVPHSLPIQHNKASSLHSNILRSQRRVSPGSKYCSFFLIIFFLS